MIPKFKEIVRFDVMLGGVFVFQYWHYQDIRKELILAAVRSGIIQKRPSLSNKPFKYYICHA